MEIITFSEYNQQRYTICPIVAAAAVCYSVFARLLNDAAVTCSEFPANLEIGGNLKRNSFFPVREKSGNLRKKLKSGKHQGI